MKADYHSAAVSALKEIQGVLHRHSIRKPDATPDMSEEPTDGKLADKNEDAMMSAHDQLIDSGEAGEGESAGTAMKEAEAQENAIEGKEPEVREPMRIVSYGGRGRSMLDEPAQSDVPSGMHDVSPKRGRGRPRKY